MINGTQASGAPLVARSYDPPMKPDAKDLVNLRRLDEAMEARGLDALVARAGLNFTYLAGFAYPGALARHVDLADSPRAVYVVWPRRGEPRIVLNAIVLDVAERDSWIEKFDVYEGYVEAPIHRLATTLDHMALVETTVGYNRTNTPPADFLLPPPHAHP